MIAPSDCKRLREGQRRPCLTTELARFHAAVHIQYVQREPNLRLNVIQAEGAARNLVELLDLIDRPEDFRAGHLFDMPRCCIDALAASNGVTAVEGSSRLASTFAF